MKTKIYISRQNEGWKEVIIPDNFKRYSYDALISVMHKFIDLSQYKGILVTENPEMNKFFRPNYTLELCNKH